MDARASGMSPTFEGMPCNNLSGDGDISLIPTHADLPTDVRTLQDSKNGSALPDEAAVGVTSAGAPAAAPKTGRRARLSPEEARARINLRQMGYRDRCRQKAEIMCAAVEQVRSEIAALRLEQAELRQHNGALGMLVSYTEDVVETLKAIPKADASISLRSMMLQWVGSRQSLPSDTLLRCAPV